MAELFVPRGIQFAVLRSVAILGNRAYGTEIQEFLDRNADKYLPAAQIYVALQRLQDRGLVQSNHEDAHLPTQGQKSTPSLKKTALSLHKRQRRRLSWHAETQKCSCARLGRGILRCARAPS